MRTLAWLVVLLAGQAAAHEKWFIEADRYPVRWDLFFQPLPLALVAFAVLLTAACGVWQRARGGRGLLPGPGFFGAAPGRLALLYAVIPAIVAVHVAVPLLVNGVRGNLLSPNAEVPGGWAYPVGLLQVGVALALFYGGFTRAAALVLAALWLVSFPLVGVGNTLDNVFYLGVAGFFWLASRGPLSVGRLILPRTEVPAPRADLAVPVLRALTGLSFIFVAFTEKFANIPLGVAFLQEYPINVAQALGLPIDDRLFLLLAGTVELLVGLFLLTNVFVREVIVLAWLPFNLTLTVFAWQELIGHLPIYGIMALLLVWGGGGRDQRALWRRGLRDLILPAWRGRRVRDRVASPRS